MVAAPTRSHADRSVLADTQMRTTLRGFRYGSGDPTTQLSPGEFWRATRTPDGPATVRIRWSADRVEHATFGPGREWIEARVPSLIGERDQPALVATDHPVVARAQHNHPYLRIGASGMLYHELLPNILGQRITAGEAVAQWRRLVVALAEPAPGPNTTLRLPPHPDRLAEMPLWWFHPLGIEMKRAVPLVETARRAAHLWRWTDLPAPQRDHQLMMLRGVGLWTTACAVAQACGDPDAVAVGDYHLKNQISYALANEPRGTDERMLQLLQPYAGQRGRVIRLIGLDGHRPPKFGPRQRVLPMWRW